MDAEDAPCERCWVPVHLQHDPPTPCGRVLCASCGPCECDECAWDVTSAVNAHAALVGLPRIQRAPQPPPTPEVDDSGFDHDEQGRPTSNAAIGWRARARNR